MSNKKCPKCGSSFRCEGDEDCWCESVNIHRAPMQEILELYSDCLCSDCLKGYEARE
ncbi:MAG: cysteine-rich CWC family protein [Bacteroidales bacterium]|nr:cysteine-rich CWC family protein [Bacteroidales bacterium]